MTLAAAVWWCERGVAVAVLQQAVEHLTAGPRHAPMRTPLLHLPRAALALLLLVGCPPAPLLVGLLACGLALLVRFDGPFNGGSDRLGLLLLAAVTAARVWPTGQVPAVAIGYLAVQVVASYALAGWVKLVNPDWRSGLALRDVFAWSAYPASASLRALAARPRVLRWLGWAVVGLELGFPLALIDARLLTIALAAAAGFHLGAAWLFGLNRFVWVWLASYPALVWFQALLGGL